MLCIGDLVRHEGGTSPLGVVIAISKSKVFSTDRIVKVLFQSGRVGHLTASAVKKMNV